MPLPSPDLSAAPRPPRCLAVLILLLVGGCVLTAADIALRAPLTTVVRLAGDLPAGGCVITAELTVPPDAPADLGVGAFVSDRHGRWFQRVAPGILAPGTHRVRIALGDDDPVAGIGPSWDAAQAEATVRGGLFFWSASASRAVIAVGGLRATPAEISASTANRLTGLTVPGGTLRTGERWEATLLPLPFPANPYAPDEFALDLVVTTPAGRIDRFPGFSSLPMANRDRGDRELVLPTGGARFHVRWRPREPGVHRLRLEARWRTGSPCVHDLGPVTVGGAPWDGYVRVDPVDHRFFTVDGQPFWPIGTNLRAVTDSRCAEAMGTRLTPDRGTLAYDAFLARLGAAGGTAAEIWLSSWNLALEWRGDWPEFQGLGRYSEERAWRLDRILDLAWARGIRLQVVINNHGQLSENVDREWGDNPYGSANGGPLDHATRWFTDPGALARQDALRRYLVARYADHPAVLGWKLLSEQNLTAAGRDLDVLAAWHRGAAVRWGQLDTYRHPLTTHWSGNWRNVRGEVAGLPEIDFLTIDAYHDTARDGAGETLSQVLELSVRERGPGRFRKPILVSEYGGHWSACPAPQMAAEHASGAFLALVCGHAGSPMLWWFEWVDQGDHFAPYHAIAAFIAGEDPRGANARSLPLNARDDGADLWCRAWSRPGNLLGYVLDEEWGALGERSPEHRATVIHVADAIAAGAMSIAWWDADLGTERIRTEFIHPGGPLDLTAPPWRRHLAFKLIRR